MVIAIDLCPRSSFTLYRSTPFCTSLVAIEVTRRYARLTDSTRREEYFRAMAKIEKGEIDGTYR